MASESTKTAFNVCFLTEDIGQSSSHANIDHNVKIKRYDGKKKSL